MQNGHLVWRFAVDADTREPVIDMSTIFALNGDTILREGESWANF